MTQPLVLGCYVQKGERLVIASVMYQQRHDGLVLVRCVAMPTAAATLLAGEHLIENQC